MSATSGSFTAVDQASSSIVLKQGERITAALSGTFVATVVLQKAVGTAGWENKDTFQRSPSSGDYTAEPGTYRLFCSAYTSGTVTYVLSSVAIIETVASIRVGRVATELLALGTSYVDIEGLTFSIEALKTYAFEFTIACDVDAVTTGIDIAVNGPASPTYLMYSKLKYNASAGIVEKTTSTYDDDDAPSASQGAVQRAYKLRGVIYNGVNAGTLAARIRREAVGTGPNVRIPSWGVITQLF